jgi:hypothetical protein
VELVLVVGSYTALAMAFDTSGIELDSELRGIDAPPIPEAKDHERGGDPEHGDGPHHLG